MKVLYDTVSSDYTHLLSKADVGRIKDYVAPEVWRAIDYIRFGFSAKSNRAGRMVTHGRRYSIRVNFCPRRAQEGLESPIVCNDRPYLQNVRRYGGKLDLASNTIKWDMKNARRYAFYVLLHEIGHVDYAEKDLPGANCRHSDPREEDWCDNYSAQLMRKMGL